MVFSRKRKDNRSPSFLLDDSPKRTKVQAQRKFAQGSNVNSPVLTPVEEIEKEERVLPEPIELLPMKRPNTEDFLTFLCFRGTPVLPPSLNFFNNASMIDTRPHNNEATTTSPKNGVLLPSISKTQGERPFIAFGVRKRADPIVVSRHMDKKRRHALALQALRRKYQEQKMAKIRAITISKLSEKVHTNKTVVRTTRSVTKTDITKKNINQKTKITVVATKRVKVTTRRTSTLKSQPRTVKPKMCLRSYRGRFVQRELVNKPVKKRPIDKTAVRKLRNLKDEEEDDDDDDDDEDMEDEEEEEEEEEVEEFSTEDDEPLKKPEKKQKLARKSASVVPKKPMDIRLTRSANQVKLKPRRIPVQNRILLRTQNKLKSPPNSPRLRSQLKLQRCKLMRKQEASKKIDVKKVVKTPTKESKEEEKKKAPKKKEDAEVEEIKKKSIKGKKSFEAEKKGNTRTSSRCKESCDEKLTLKTKSDLKKKLDIKTKSLLPKKIKGKSNVETTIKEVSQVNELPESKKFTPTMKKKTPEKSKSNIIERIEVFKKQTKVNQRNEIIKEVEKIEIKSNPLNETEVKKVIETKIVTAAEETKIETHLEIVPEKSIKCRMVKEAVVIEEPLRNIKECIVVEIPKEVRSDELSPSIESNRGTSNKIQVSEEITTTTIFNKTITKVSENFIETVHAKESDKLTDDSHEARNVLIELDGKNLKNDLKVGKVLGKNVSNEVKNDAKIDVKDVKIDVKDVKIDVRDVKIDVRDVKIDVRGMRNDTKGNKNDAKFIKNEIKVLKNEKSVKTIAKSIKKELKSLNNELKNVKNVKSELKSIKTELRIVKAEPKMGKIEPKMSKIEPKTVRNEVKPVKCEPKSVKTELKTVKNEKIVTKPEAKSTKSEQKSVKTELKAAKVEPKIVKSEPKSVKVDAQKKVDERPQRPSRKTKEAAAIYMEILGHRLVNDDDIDDDDISIDSFPELPNVRKTEQREIEMKARVKKEEESVESIEAKKGVKDGQTIKLTPKETKLKEVKLLKETKTGKVTKTTKVVKEILKEKDDSEAKEQSTGENIDETIILKKEVKDTKDGKDSKVSNERKTWKNSQDSDGDDEMEDDDDEDTSSKKYKEEKLMNLAANVNAVTDVKVGESASSINTGRKSENPEIKNLYDFLETNDDPKCAKDAKSLTESKIKDNIYAKNLKEDTASNKNLNISKEVVLTEGNLNLTAKMPEVKYCIDSKVSETERKVYKDPIQTKLSMHDLIKTKTLLQDKASNQDRNSIQIKDPALATDLSLAKSVTNLHPTDKFSLKVNASLQTSSAGTSAYIKDETYFKVLTNVKDSTYVKQIATKSVNIYQMYPVCDNALDLTAETLKDAKPSNDANVIKSINVSKDIKEVEFNDKTNLKKVIEVNVSCEEMKGTKDLKKKELNDRSESKEMNETRDLTDLKEVKDEKTTNEKLKGCNETNESKEGKDLKQKECKVSESKTGKLKVKESKKRKSKTNDSDSDVSISLRGKRKNLKPNNTRRGKKAETSDSDESFKAEICIPTEKSSRPTRRKSPKLYKSFSDTDSEEMLPLKPKQPPPPPPKRKSENLNEPEAKKKSKPPVKIESDDSFSESDEEPLVMLKKKSEVLVGKQKRECTKRPQNYLTHFSSSEEDEEEEKYFHGFVKSPPKPKPVEATLDVLTSKDLGRRFGKERVNMSNEQIEKWLNDSALASMSIIKKENDDMLKFGEKIPTETSLETSLTNINTENLKSSLLDTKVEKTIDSLSSTPEKYSSTSPIKPLSNERKQIFKKEKTKVTHNVNAFSVCNESSVYAFEADNEDSVSTPFRRPNRRPSSTATSRSEDELSRLETENKSAKFRLPSLLKCDKPTHKPEALIFSTDESNHSGVSTPQIQEAEKDKSDSFYVPLKPKLQKNLPVKTLSMSMFPPTQKLKTKATSSKSFDRMSETSEEFKYKIPSSPSASSSSSAKLSKKARANKKSENYNPINVTEFPSSLSPSRIVEAPVFHPNEKEFNDPLEYIEKIRNKAEKFGICRIVPPATFKPECKVLDEMRFTAYNQYVHKMMHRWGPNFKELVAIRKYLATQSISLKQPPWIGGMEIDLPRLYQTVQSLGGLKEVIEKKKWPKVSELMKIPKSAQDRVTKLDDIYCKYLLPYDTLSTEERDKLFSSVETEWAKRESRSLEKESREKEDEDESESDDEDETDTECIVKGRSMALNAFYRIARNTMSMWFKTPEPPAQEVEEEFWRHVTMKENHICVHSGSIDSGNWGYGFAVSKNSPFARHSWNLKVLTNNSGSILRSMGPVMGLTVPTLHVGMVFSGCCWYRDPHSLPWIEYLHTGANKIWYGIPDTMSEKFHTTLMKLVPNYCLDKSIWLPSDTAMLPPNLLVDNGVSLTRTVQEPGQFVVIFPKAFTSNICTGYVVSESVFFAGPDWLHCAKSVFGELKNSCEPAMFSYERLLLNVATDPRSDIGVLNQIIPAVKELCERERKERNELKLLGVTTEEKLPLPDVRKKKKMQETEVEYACEDCRWNLFCSMVLENQESAIYCLEHAIGHIQAKRLLVENCKLMFTYDLNELNVLVDRVKATIETKLQKKTGGKFTGMATLLNR